MRGSKPHFTFRHRVWLCMTTQPLVAGYGYTVRQAWDEWLASARMEYERGKR